MKRVFKKGDRVRGADGKVMEVLHHIDEKLVEVRWFDMHSKEVYRNIMPAHRLSKAC